MIISESIKLDIRNGNFDSLVEHLLSLSHIEMRTDLKVGNYFA